MFLPEAAQGVRCASPPSIGRSFACSHDSHHPTLGFTGALLTPCPRPGPRRLYGRLPGSRGPPAGPTDERASRSGTNRPPPPSVGPIVGPLEERSLESGPFEPSRPLVGPRAGPRTGTAQHDEPAGAPAGSITRRARNGYSRCITKNASMAIHGRPDVPRTRTVTVWLASDVKIVWRTRLAR